MNRDQNKTKNKLNQSIIEMREKALKIPIETRIRRRKKKEKKKNNDGRNRRLSP